MNGDGRMFVDKSPWIEVCGRKSNKNPTNVGWKSNGGDAMKGAMDTWRAPKSRGETHLRVSQSQVAEIVT
jgi:hypothetical protein